MMAAADTTTLAGATPHPAPRRGSVAAWLTGAIVVLAFFGGVVLDIDVPGIYMDAVNPDYLAASILNPGHSVERWVLPGNALFHRFPVLTSLYHGTGTMWLGLPVFAALGTSVESLRIAHALFACAILIPATIWLRRSGISNGVIAVIGIALALDPSFMFAFRTASYITLSPLAALLVSLLLLDRTRDAANPQRYFLAAGVAYGVALFGYFIYLFYLPAVLIAVLAWPAETAPRVAPPARLRHWTFGVFLGAILYVIGYALIAREMGGIGGLFRYIRETQRALGALADPLSFIDRLAWAWRMIEAMTHNWWHHNSMLNQYVSVPAAVAKTWLLTIVPLALWALAEGLRRSDARLRVTIGCMVSFFAVSLVFGGRLGGHHYAGLVVLGYLALALGIAALVRDRRTSLVPWRSALLATPMLLLAASSIQAQVETRARLRETGGVGLFSDAAVRFAADARREHARDFYVFPDWGLWMQFAFLTGAEIDLATSTEPAKVRALLCAGRDVHIVPIGADREKLLEEWTRALDWSPPARVTYKQRNGVPVFDVATWRGAAAGGADARCAAR
jgi:hypothetical protein